MLSDFSFDSKIDPVALLALLLTLLHAFISIGAWFFKQRAHLRIAISKVILRTLDGKTYNQVQFKVTSFGSKPITLTGFKAIGLNGSYHMGDNDPLAAAHGVEDDKFPAHLNQGDTMKFCPFSFEALERNQTNPNNPTHHFSPWLYFVLIDSHNKYHHIYVHDVLRAVHLLKTWRPLTKRQQLANFITRRRLFSKIKKHEV